MAIRPELLVQNTGGPELPRCRVQTRSEPGCLVPRLPQQNKTQPPLLPRSLAGRAWARLQAFLGTPVRASQDILPLYLTSLSTLCAPVLLTKPDTLRQIPTQRAALAYRLTLPTLFCTPQGLGRSPEALPRSPWEPPDVVVPGPTNRPFRGALCG